MLYATDSSTTVKRRLTAEGRAEALRLCPWGNAIRGFAGAGLHGERDEGFGLYMLGAGYRGYIPSLRRFNSPDSWSPFGRGGINAYGFCGGDPVNGRDPTGHNPISALEMVFSQHGVAKIFGTYLNASDVLSVGLTSKLMLNSIAPVLAQKRPIYLARAIKREKAFKRSTKKIAPALNVTGEPYSPLSTMYAMGQTVVNSLPKSTMRSYKNLTGMKAKKALRLFESIDDQLLYSDLKGPLPKRFSRFLNGVYNNFPTARQGMPEIYEHLENGDIDLFLASAERYFDDVKKAIKNGRF